MADSDSASNNTNQLDNQHTPAQAGKRNDSGTSRDVVQLSLPLLNQTTAENNIWEMYLREVKRTISRFQMLGKRIQIICSPS